jgi:outer membrane protein assembly factor BamB
VDKPGPAKAASLPATSPPRATSSSGPLTSTPPEPIPTPSPPAAEKGDFDFVLSVPAWNAVLTAGRVVVINEDLKSLSGYSAQDGRSLWRTEVGDVQGKTHLLSVRRGSVVVWAGNQMIRVDPSTGVISSAEVVDPNGSCHFAEKGAACAFVCQCPLQLAECATGKRVGKVFDRMEMAPYYLDDPSLSPCIGPLPLLLTGTGRISIVAIASRGVNRETFVVGLDASTGKEVWRSSGLAFATMRDTDSGSSPDGRTCWIGGEGGELRVADCSTGSLLWKKPKAPAAPMGARRFVRYLPERSALFRFVGNEAALFDSRTGKPLWSRALSANEAALPVGARVGENMIFANKDSPITLLLLTPEDGRVEGRVEMPGISTLRDDPGGGLYLHGKEEIVAFEASGRERWRLRQPTPSSPYFHQDFLGLSEADRLVLFERAGAKRLGELRGSFGIQQGSSLTGGILLYRLVERGTKVGQALLVPPRR